MGQEETRYDRTTLGPGAIAWVYEYRNRAAKARRDVKPFFATWRVT